MTEAYRILGIDEYFSSDEQTRDSIDRWLIEKDLGDIMVVAVHRHEFGIDVEYINPGYDADFEVDTLFSIPKQNLFKRNLIDDFPWPEENKWDIAT